MIAELKIKSHKYIVILDFPFDISIPLVFNGMQPNSYDVEIASSKAVETPDFIGDTRRGGSCNFEEIRMIPHCNGTHTECVGHISYERISINETLKDIMIPSVLVTVQPVNSAQVSEIYEPSLDPKDKIITAESIEAAIKEFNEDFRDGLVIRTLPNDESKKSRRYIENQPPFFSIEAMILINSLGVNHLLVDVPSVDRAFDEGKLTVHHMFWDVKQGSHDVDKQKHSLKTITEMIYVPDEVKDGEYLLNLQIAPFVSDASPSKPVLFKIKN